MPQDFRNDILLPRESTESSTRTTESSAGVRVHFFAEPLHLPNQAVRLRGAPSASAVDATRQSHLFSNTHLAISFTRPIIYRPHEMAEPKKQEKDYTKEVDALLPETKSLAEVRGDDPD